MTINGRRRRVVSAEQIRTDTNDEGPSTAHNGLASTAPKRVIMVAVDCISFDVTGSRDVIQNIAEFVRGLQPDDYVGLAAYPNGACDRARPPIMPRSFARSTTVVGQRDGPGLGRFNLRPTEIIDASRDIPVGRRPHARRAVRSGMRPGHRRRTAARCCSPRSPAPPLYYEGQATASVGMLRNVIMQMQGYPGRKTLLLVSGGMIASDTPGGRPDIGSIGIQAGKEAATANTAIYTLFVDNSLHDRYGAETRKGDRTVDQPQPRHRGDGAVARTVRRLRRRRALQRHAATPRRRSRGFRTSCRRTTCSASNRRTRTATAARTKSR